MSSSRVALFWPGDSRAKPNERAIPSITEATMQLERALKLHCSFGNTRDGPLIGFSSTVTRPKQSDSGTRHMAVTAHGERLHKVSQTSAGKSDSPVARFHRTDGSFGLVASRPSRPWSYFLGLRPNPNSLREFLVPQFNRIE